MMRGLPTGLSIFATAYDPLDLVATSIDPLGFLKGYLTLADLLLPSLTTVTTVPRYLPMLCRGLKLAQELHPFDSALQPAKSRSRRVEVLRNFEKLWALGCGLTAERKNEAAVAGLRGYMRYVKPFLQANAAHSDLSIGSLNLLSNQVRYGGIGAYTQMLDGCHFIDALTLTLRPLGEELADAFPAITSWSPEHPNIRLSREALLEWGRRVSVDTLTSREAKLIRAGLRGGIEAEYNDEVRWQSLLLLKAAGAGFNAEAECLDRMSELLNSAANKDNTPARSQLQVVIDIIEPFEQLYQSLVFIFDELRAAATETPAGYPIAKVNRSKAARTALTVAVRSEKALNKSIVRGETVNAAVTSKVVRALQDSGIIALASEVSSAQSIGDSARILLNRHSLVQSGKFDRGQPKAPWMRLSNGMVHLTSQRNQLLREAHVDHWQEISRHPYRTWAAGQFIEQCRIT